MKNKLHKIVKKYIEIGQGEEDGIVYAYFLDEEKKEMFKIRVK